MSAGRLGVAPAETEPGTVSPVGLYAHFPFCLSICPYCDFVVVAGRTAKGPDSAIGRILEALRVEVGLRAEAYGPGRRPLRTIYLGGGTPSLMSAAQVGALLEQVDRRFGTAAGVEVTLEVNPGPAERGDLAGFRSAGVNRLSVGAQSMVAPELRRIGRRHTPSDVAETVAQARRAGFDNVSLDLLYDIPGQSLASWRRTLDEALALAPDHLSAYALTLDDPDGEGLTAPSGDHLPVRTGARRWRERARPEQDADRAADMYVLADELLGRAGLAWYELSNWARPGQESRHNLAYWSGDAWAAVGPGAHAFDGRRLRSWTSAHLGIYLDALAANRLPPGGWDATDEATAAAERAMLRLRTAAGLDTVALNGPACSALAWALASGLLETSGDALRLTVAGRLLSNEVFTRLLPEPALVPR